MRGRHRGAAATANTTAAAFGDTAIAAATAGATAAPAIAGDSAIAGAEACLMMISSNSWAATMWVTRLGGNS